MATIIGYSPPGNVRNFSCLRTATLWAGGLGMVQALVWMGLTIAGIISYNCLINADTVLTFGSLLRTVFLDLYFKGNCLPDGYQQYNNTVLKSVDTVLDPTGLLIWECVYLGCAVCWLLSSTLLLTHVRQNRAKLTAGIIFTWVFFTFAISSMDLALGIIFGIDYGSFQAKAYNANFNTINAGPVDPQNAQLLAGSVTAMSLMIIAFKGFVLWIINVSLMIYLLARAVFIASNNDGNDTLFIPRKNSDDILTTRPPINAYEEEKPSTGFTNEAYVPDTRSTGTIELNQEALARAARMSTDATLHDRRFRNIDSFQQYPPPRSSSNNNNNNNNNNSNNNNPKLQETFVTATAGLAPFPAPDYSPPMTRANQGQSQNTILRIQRSQ